MSVSTRSVPGGLAAIVGRERLSEDPAALAGAAIDGRAPRWLVRPVSVDELSRLVALAHDAGLAVTPRGSGSSLAMGRPPARLDMVVDLQGLARIVEYSPDDLTVTVEAGVTAGQLASLLGAHRQFLPVDPPGAAGRTLGGLVATNATGPLRCRYGGLRDLLLGVRFVQADGVVTWGGAKVVKSVAGYDVPKLMVGSFGTLGILAELTLRLHARPECERTWLVTFSSASAADQLVAAVLDSSIQPMRLQWLNARALGEAGGPAAPVAVAVALGSVEAAVVEQGERLRDLAKRSGGELHGVTERWWSAWDRILYSGQVMLRVAVPASGLAATASAIEEALREDPAHVVAACAATGVFTIIASDAVIGTLPRAVETLRSFVSEHGGHVMVARAPQSMRGIIDPWGGVDPSAFQLMRRLKQTFDPAGTLNPGRFVGGL